MQGWLVLIIIGVVLMLLGVFTDLGMLLVWIGLAILVISLILGFVRRGRTGV